MALDIGLKSETLFAAEVASTCNSALMINYMLENAKTKEEKLYILDYYIKMFTGTFFTQLFFSEFELKAEGVVYFSSDIGFDLDFIYYENTGVNNEIKEYLTWRFCRA